MKDFRKILFEADEINKITGAPKLTHPVWNILESDRKAIDIAVLGQFKSGKSSLINSLIGECILPVGAVPVTAVITRVSYGILPHCKVHLNSRDQFDIGLEDIHLYVTEKYNPENVKEVAYVSVESPSFHCGEHIHLTDTPGLGSFTGKPAEPAMDWSPAAGAALICISADRPLSSADMNLIRIVSGYCPFIGIVITKSDLLQKEELEGVRSYIHSALRREINVKIPIFEYSLRNDQQKHRDRLVNTFVRPLDEDHEQKLDEIIHFKTAYIIGQSLQYAELAARSCQKRDKDKSVIKALLHDMNDNRRHLDREMQLSNTAFKGEIRKKLESILLPCEKQMIAKISGSFANEYPGWRGFLPGVARQFEGWLKTKLGEEIAVVENESFTEITAILSEPAAYFEYAALRFYRHLNDKVFGTFGVNLPATSWQIDFKGIDKPDVSVYRTFDSNLDMLLFFLPVQYTRGLFYTHFSKQIPREVEKNLFRFISGLTEKIFRVLDQYHQQSRRFISDISSGVEDILLSDRSELAVLMEETRKLKKLKEMIRGLRR